MVLCPGGAGTQERGVCASQLQAVLTDECTENVGEPRLNRTLDRRDVSAGWFQLAQALHSTRTLNFVEADNGAILEPRMQTAHIR
jgi:hypothetical protein